MPDLPTTAFDLPARLVAKAAPALVARDEQHFALIATSLKQQVEDLTRRLDEARRAPGRGGTAALERDQEVHRLSARLRLLRRFGLDLCLGRSVSADDETVYVGRIGLTDAEGRRLLVDWRSPAAEPFFAATHADPRGLVSRRRYRWTRGRVSDYWDEAFTIDGLEHGAALDDQSAFLASLAGARSARMRDVLGTIQADQHAVIRADSRGTLVVDGGPGTGKTVVALHRAASLLYSDPRLGHRRGGLLFVGPHEPYLDYVSDVLPSLGEEGVRACTLRDLVPEGADARPERNPEVARLKGSAELVHAIEPAVRFSEQPPRDTLVVETPWVDLRIGPADWAAAFDAPEPGTPHNEAREQVWDGLVEILLAQVEDDDVPLDQLRAALARDRDLVGALHRSWPLVEAPELVADLWSVPAYLRRCAPHLTDEEVMLLQREDPCAWTFEDLPLLDAARRRLGDGSAPSRRRLAARTEAAQRASMDDVVDRLVESDDSELQVMSMLRLGDLRDALVDPGALPDATADPLAGPFAHVVVDEAQELTDAQWLMLLARCPSRSLTVVGDRAQARHGFTSSWSDRLARVGLADVRLATLSINFRTPVEVMREAEPVIRAAVPDANVPTSVRSTGLPVVRGRVHDLAHVVSSWLASHDDGLACVIGDPSFPDSPRVRSLTPEGAKGLEFDLVVLVEPSPSRTREADTGVRPCTEAAVDRYVAMTRSTHELVVLT